MKYLPDAKPMPVLELSRRNLEALLAKLDDPASARTLLSPGAPGEPILAVVAVENDAHYSARASGEVYMPTSDEAWPVVQPTRACTCADSNATGATTSGHRCAACVADASDDPHRPPTQSTRTGDDR